MADKESISAMIERRYSLRLDKSLKDALDKAIVADEGVHDKAAAQFRANKMIVNKYRDKYGDMAYFKEFLKFIGDNMEQITEIFDPVRQKFIAKASAGKNGTGENTGAEQSG